jgi:hypothetical protein
VAQGVWVSRRNRQKHRATTSAGKPEGRDPQEWTKLVFDYYKHIATLNGVGAAVLLAVYPQEILSKDIVGLALIFFGLGVLCCAWGMMPSLSWFPLSPGTRQAADVPLFAQLAGNFFAQAVASALAAALDLPDWLLITTLLILLGMLVWTLSGRNVFGYGFPRSKEPPP